MLNVVGNETGNGRSRWTVHHHNEKFIPELHLAITQECASRLAETTAASRVLPMSYFSGLSASQRICWNLLVLFEDPLTLHISQGSKTRQDPSTSSMVVERCTVTILFPPKVMMEGVPQVASLEVLRSAPDELLSHPAIYCCDEALRGVIVAIEGTSIESLRASIPSRDAVVGAKWRLFSERLRSLLLRLEALRKEVLSAGMDFYLHEGVSWCQFDDEPVLLGVLASISVISDEALFLALFRHAIAPSPIEEYMRRALEADATVSLATLLTSCRIGLLGRGTKKGGYRLSFAPRVVGACEHHELCFGNMHFNFLACEDGGGGGGDDSSPRGKKRKKTRNRVAPLSSIHFQAKQETKDCTGRGTVDVAANDNENLESGSDVEDAPDSFSGPLTSPCSRRLIPSEFCLVPEYPSDAVAPSHDECTDLPPSPTEPRPARMGEALFHRELELRLDRWLRANSNRVEDSSSGSGGEEEEEKGPSQNEDVDEVVDEDPEDPTPIVCPAATPAAEKGQVSMELTAAPSNSILKVPLHVLLVEVGTLTLTPRHARARRFLQRRLRGKGTVVRLLQFVQRSETLDYELSGKETVPSAMHEHSVPFAQKLFHRMHQVARSGLLGIGIIERKSSYGGVLIFACGMTRVVFSETLQLAIPTVPTERPMIFFDLDQTLIDNSPEHRIFHNIEEHTIAYVTRDGLRRELVYVRPQVMPFLKWLGSLQDASYVTLSLVTKSKATRAAAGANLLNAAQKKGPGQDLFPVIVSAEDLLNDLFDREPELFDRTDTSMRAVAIILYAKKRAQRVVDKIDQHWSVAVSGSGGGVCCGNKPVISLEPEGKIVIVDDAAGDWDEDDHNKILKIDPFNGKFDMRDESVLFDASGQCDGGALAAQITDRWLKQVGASCAAPPCEAQSPWTLPAIERPPPPVDANEVRPPIVEEEWEETMLRGGSCMRDAEDVVLEPAVT